MRFPRISSRVLPALAALVAVVVFGCSKKTVSTLIPNQRPLVEITSAPIDTRDTSFYAYQISWDGYDPDGRVDHFTYAVDPTATDTAWVRTTQKQHQFFFSAYHPVLGGLGSTRSVAPHVVVVRSWDNLGMPSEVKFRAFYSYTVAPTVFITSPIPQAALLVNVTPATQITWVGTDPDGQFSQKPIKYKYKLLPKGNSEFSYDLARSNPDSLRRFFEKTNFATWDSVGGDTTSVRYTNLLPNKQYIFVVIAYDEAGAYSPVFTLTGNMLVFNVGFAGTLGPVITTYNESFYYKQPYGSWSPNLPSSWLLLEVPASQPVRFNWFATPPVGSLIAYYRWRLDGDPNDDTPRTDEANDLSHWSAQSAGTLTCLLPGFAPGQQHFFYVGAWDDNGLKSLQTILITPVKPTYEKSVLVVNDTRGEVDQFSGGKVVGYTTYWPATAELDTFLFARGGTFWRGTQVAATAPVQPVTPPGLFAGYDFDTLGTRQGLEIQSTGVPLSLLGKYKHVIWLTDHNSVVYTGTGTDPIQTMSALRYICKRNNMNTLGAYMTAGGSVWLSGGSGGYAATINFNATGANNNDLTYGSGKTVFSFDKNELIPGRLMYDGAHWQNEFVFQNADPGGLSRIGRSAYTPRPWTHPAYKEPYYGSSTVYYTSPDYTKLPSALRMKALSLGDSLPPTRTNAAQYYGISLGDWEFLSKENRVIEDVNQDADNPNMMSVLDTLISADGTQLANTGNERVLMTWYHGVTHADFVFTGFSFWLWTRPDCISLVDFVMQDIWHLPRASIARTPQASLRPFATSRPTGRPAAPPASVGRRLPTNRLPNR